jgi:prevent-host-death family protein
MRYWQLQEAKAKLSELVHLTLEKGPQGISVRGKEEVVLLSKKTYETITGKKPSFIAFLKESPLRGLSLDLERDRSHLRDSIEL